MNNAVNWFEIYTDNFQRAKKFYTTVFQCELTDVPAPSDRHSEMRYATFPSQPGVAGTGGALVKLDVVSPGIGGTLIYFATEGIDAELGRVEPAGGKVIRPKLAVDGFGFIALIEDTEGNLIGLHSMR